MTTKTEQRARLTADANGNVYRDGEPVPVSDNGYGYLKCRAGHETFKVHRIVAEELLGPPGPGGDEGLARLLSGEGRWDVAHKNGNKHDNRVGNLMWCPHRFNAAHELECPLLIALREEHNRQEAKAHRVPRKNARPTMVCPRCGVSYTRSHRSQVWCSLNCSRRWCAKLDREKASEIRMLAASMSHEALAKLFGVSRQTISKTVHGLRWTA